MAKTLAAVPAAALLLLLAFLCFTPVQVQCQDTPEVRQSLIDFLRQLAGGDDQVARELGWDVSVPPCGDDTPWRMASCLKGKTTDGRVRAVLLESLGPKLNGTINATLLCTNTAIRVLSVPGNALRGSIPAELSSCKGLTHLNVSGNQLSGALPPSLSQLGDLHVIDVSRNNFSGEIPADLGKLEVLRFFANDNRFDGTIPDFNLSRIDDDLNFDVSNNNLTGPIPKNGTRFGRERFWPNAAGICGEPFFDSCPPPPQAPSPARRPNSGGSEAEPDAGEDGDDDDTDKDKYNKRIVRKIVMYLGYVLLGAAILSFVLYRLCFKKRRNKLGLKQQYNKPRGGGGRGVYDSSRMTTTTTATTTASATPTKTTAAYSLPTSGEHSAAAAEAPPSASLVVLRRSGTGTASITSNAAAAAAKELRFEDLLKSPAELLGRGRFGSSYKVVVPGGAALAVKRVKDAAVDEEEFRRRMERVGQAKHPAVLPPLAFYCAMQEKLVVYEFQSNGSLAKLLHGSIENSQAPLDWPARLHIAAKVADGMAFMHHTLRGDGGGASSKSNSSSGEKAATATDGPIAHGNLKASNVLFTAGMDPCISEYGITTTPAAGAAAFRADVRALGVLLLELLTGKATSAQGDGAELARWVTSVIREEWTAEVFDRALLAGSGGDGSAEQRMVRLLQVAMRCVNESPGSGSAPPPTMREVAAMINAIRDDDDRSVSFEA